MEGYSAANLSHLLGLINIICDARDQSLAPWEAEPRPALRGRAPSATRNGVAVLHLHQKRDASVDKSNCGIGWHTRLCTEPWPRHATQKREIAIAIWNTRLAQD